MKTLALLLTTLVGLNHLHAVEPTKSLVTLSAKVHKLDSEHDLRGRQGSSRERTVTLRVEIVNTSSTALPASELTGDALIFRAGDIKEKTVKESLGMIKVPAMKPNEKLTFDLGKIELKEIEFRNRKFEETLEEWQVTCNQGTTEIGKALSSDRYTTLLKDLGPQGKGKDPEKRKARKALAQ